MLYFIGFWGVILADTFGIGGLVDRFGWWLNDNDRLTALDLGIHDGIMRDWDR
jgi:hypothetical protein